MKIKIIISSLSFLSIFIISNTAFATLKVVPDRPVEPAFICKTESDIIIARTMAITRGGGPDFAGSAEVLCRSQIEANQPKTTIIYQQSPSYSNQESATNARLRGELACKSIVLGASVNSDGKCVCPEGKSAVYTPDQKEMFICLNSTTSTSSASNFDSTRLRLALSSMIDDFLKEKPEYTKLIDRDLILNLVLANPDKYNNFTMARIVNLIYGSADKNVTATTTVATSTASSTPKLSKPLKMGVRGDEVKLLQSLLCLE